MIRRRFLAALASAASAQAASWPQWRGPGRDGLSPETGLLDRWPDGGPELLWKVEALGEGYSSYAVVDGKLYTQGQEDGRQHLIAVDAASGATLWKTPHGDTYGNNRGNGPRGAPTFDGGRLYAIGGDGNLVCTDAATGKIVWQKHLLREFGGSNINWGLSESPLIDGDRIIVNAGGKGASVVALNKADGALVWKTADDEAGYSSAVISNGGGVKQYVLLTGEAGIGVRASDGKLLWRYTQVSNPTANIATPIVRGDHVFLSSDYGTGCALLELSAAGGGVEAREVYFNRDMRNHYSSCVLLGDHLYGYSSRILTCMEFLTGKVAWEDRSVGKGQIVHADGKLYLLSEDGVVGMADATPRAYRELSRFEIGRGNYPTWTLPAIADGKLYLRDQELLYCYDIRG